MQDQVEIIKVNGDIEFHDLDASRGITNIGQHPDNDIVIDSPDVAPFHAILDHRQRPYQFMLLSPMGETRLSGKTLSQNISVNLTGWDTIEMNGHTLILIEAETFPGQPSPSDTREDTTAVVPVPVGAQISEPQTAVEATPTVETAPAVDGSLQPTTAPTALVSEAGALGLASLPPDERDENIILELEEREWTVEAGQSISFQITIGNGGSLVAAFVVSVEGIGPSWVEIIPPQINLNEGARSNVTISITPPRHPTSRAGAHYFSVTVTSANYPGRRSRVGGTLTISPFYQFNIGELSPKEQSTNWFRPAGQATFSLSNRGNSTTLFQLEGVDTQQGCSFEFDIPGETTSLATRVELRLPPEETVAIPIQIIPHSRSLFLRGLNYSYTITALTLEGVHTPLSILGQLKTKPLIRLWHVILFMLFTMVLLSYIFRPQARELKVNGQIVSQEVKVGTPVTLSWEASRFAVVRVECKAAGECPPASILDQPVGQMVIEPTADAIYVLQARNLLSEVPIVGPALFQPSKESPLVIVTPVRPLIQDFSVNTDTILSGQPVTLRWEVDNADEVILRTNDAPEALATAQHIGQKTESLEADTVYILEAKNSYGPDTKNLRVKVSTPTPTLTPFPPTATPIPTPFVKTFFADRDTINPGDNVTISWEVIGADIVSVQPIGNEVPPVQTLSQSPQESTIYTLSASNGPVRIEPRTIEVKVNTPTPAPEQPIIQVFTASESEVTKGDNTGVLLSWSITGNPETIELVGPNGLALPILEAQSSLSVTVNDSASFILTALTENLKDSKAVQINGIDPTPTPTPTPPPLPEANIELFQISQPVGPQVIDLGGSNPHRYQVQVNTTVTFLWQVNSAAVQAILTEDGVTPISQGVPFMMHNVIISKAGSFVLTAENAEGQRDQRTISIEITDQLPPHPPFNVAVEEDVAGNQNILTWDWTFNPARSNIVGFRVYRLDDPNGNATRIADESILTVEATKRYIDQVNPTCGRAYYVRAVYRDISGQLQESGASTNTWYTGQC